MPESPPSRDKTSTQRTSSAARDSSRSAGAPAVQVRYCRRMRPQRVYPVVVGWASKGRPAAEPIVVRLLMAGAQVVPAEHTLNPAEPDEKVTFYVTPLAKGQLRGERLEVLQGGRKVQEIKLPCKVTTQRATWIWLLLTLLVCWFVVPAYESPIKERRPAVHAELGDDELVEYYNTQTSLAVRLNRYLLPVLPLIDQHAPGVARGLEEVTDYIGAFYSWSYYASKDTIPLPEILTGVMVLLTLFSWWVHLERRGRRVGKPLPASGGGGDDN